MLYVEWDVYVQPHMYMIHPTYTFMLKRSTEMLSHPLFNIPYFFLKNDKVVGMIFLEIIPQFQTNFWTLNYAVVFFWSI